MSVRKYRLAMGLTALPRHSVVLRQPCVSPLGTLGRERQRTLVDIPLKDPWRFAGNRDKTILQGRQLRLNCSMLHHAPKRALRRPSGSAPGGDGGHGTSGAGVDAY